MRPGVSAPDHQLVPAREPAHESAGKTSRIPAETQAGLEVVQVSLRSGHQPKDVVPAACLHDAVVHVIQACQGVAGGLIAQTIIDGEAGPDIPCILREEKEVVHLVILDQSAARERLVNVGGEGDVVYKVLERGISQPTAREGNKKRLYFDASKVDAELDEVSAMRQRYRVL